MFAFALIGASMNEGETLLGIYSSCEQAFKARMEFQTKMGDGYFDEYQIMKYTLDEAAFEIKE